MRRVGFALRVSCAWLLTGERDGAEDKVAVRDPQGAARCPSGPAASRPDLDGGIGGEGADTHIHGAVGVDGTAWAAARGPTGRQGGV